ncbi:MAG: response regulator transcription factor [Planctomycetota bacterium]
MRLLLVEDSESLVFSLKKGFKRLGYAVDVALDGKKGLSYALREPYDAIVLDLMLPLMDGIAVLTTLRNAGSDVPVLLLTARDGVSDRIKGLRMGADDYLVKPFAFDELVARVEALVRRRCGKLNAVTEIGDLVIDTTTRSVTRGGDAVSLTAREFALLNFLANRRGETVSRIEIEDHLYGEENFPMSNVVPSAISTLRDKLGGKSSRPLIHTRRGLGYVLDEQAP